MKIINIILKVLLCLLLIAPVLGALGIFPAPTADMYNTPEAFNFINMLFETKYIINIEALVFLTAIILTFKNRMALVALLILPITVNVVGFHAFLDGGLLTGGAIMGNMLLVINVYFLWQNRHKYKVLWIK